jgi:hypothetical protein
LLSKRRELSILAVAAQCGAVGCVRWFLMNGAKVGGAEVEAAFRSGNNELMRSLWDAFPRATPIELALEAVKSWNVAGLCWLLDHKMRTLSSHDLVRLFQGACSSGSYSCGSSVLGFSGHGASHLRGLPRIGVIGRVLCDGRASRKPDRETFFIPQDSIAAGYAEDLREWLPEATEVRLVARHEGRDAASVRAFVGAAKKRAKTLTFVETENGCSICGGYLDAPWVEWDFAKDPDRKSFIFTLKNHLAVPPTKWVIKGDRGAALMSRDNLVCFGCREGFIIWVSDLSLYNGSSHEAPDEGAALFTGDDDWRFHAARWELWEVM